MCSVEEEAIARVDGELQCVKCRRDVPVVVRRVNDAFCQECFLVYAVHKFRSAIGKSKVIVPKEHVLVAFSGGAASSALLHFLQEGMKEGKLRFTATILHVDELCLVSVSEAERREKCEAVVKTVLDRGFPLLWTRLEQAMDLSPEGAGGSHSPAQTATTGAGQQGDKSCPVQLCGEVTGPEQLPIAGAGQQGDKLKALLRSLSVSAREEFLRVLRTQLLVGVARQRGFDKVVMGDTATALAVRIMTDFSKGKGSQVAMDTSIGDARYKDVTVVRPIRDLNMAEVEAYNRLQHVPVVSLPRAQDQWQRGSSIEQLTATFVHGLQENFPSTVPNIVRTSGKLGQQDMDQVMETCAMCQSSLDTCVGEASALRAVEVSETLLQADNPPVLQSTPNANDTHTNRFAYDALKTSLCYGCRLTLKDMKDVSLLPTHVVQRSQSRSLTREEMRAQISEFLLEEIEPDS